MVLAPVGSTYTLPGLWHFIWMGLAKGVLEGAEPQEKAGVEHTMVASSVESVGSVLVPTHVPVFRLEDGGGKWCPSAPLFLEKSPIDLCPFSTHSEISK